MTVDQYRTKRANLASLTKGYRTALASEAAVVRDPATLLLHVFQNFERIAASAAPGANRT